MIDVATITVSWSPSFQLGPLELSWHGILIATGIAVAAVVAGLLLRRRGQSADELWNLVPIAALAGMVGARALFLIEDGSIADPSRWLGTHGFSIYGAVVAALVAAGIYAWRRRLDVVYIGAAAVAFPLGDAVGRVGCLVAGDHVGAPTSLPWGVRYLDSAVGVPQVGVTYHSGALYEILAALLIFPVMLFVWQRAREPLAALWAVLALFGAARFVIFFWRTDSASWLLGLSEAQWTSLGLIAVGAAGALLTHARHRDLIGRRAHAAPA